MTDPQARTRFVAEVRGVAPNVAGGLVQQLEAGRTIAESFRTALLGAAIGIAAVLFLLLRDIVWVVRLLMPLVLGGLLTLATLVLLGIPFNFANVIALPLLLGVGVDNGVHMGLRLREGARTEAVLHGTTVRALLFGSLTTVVSFGNLALSPHQGTASLGVALGMGMLWILLTTVTLLPALVPGHEGGRRE
jgi:predicted RND superfamily exporter protein